MAEEAATDTPSLGFQVLKDLMRGLELEDLTSRVSVYGDYDASLITLRKACPDGVDPSAPEHRQALLKWLRQWGCRHLSKRDEATSSDALAEWGEIWIGRLPPPSVALLDLDDEGIAEAAEAYGALAAAPAALRRRKSGDSVVRFGPTAAAKALYAIRPRVYAPWDDPIREALGLSGVDAAYFRYLTTVASALRALAHKSGFAVEDLPGHVNRPDSTPPKLIDEYLWMRITKGR